MSGRYAAVMYRAIQLLTDTPDQTRVDVLWFDTQGMDPVPQVGWTLNADGVSFSAPTPAPTLVPVTVSAAQAKIALSRAGLLSSVNTYIAGLTDEAGIETQIWWANATVFERNNPTLVAVGTALGLTNDQIDSLFETAAGITS